MTPHNGNHVGIIIATSPPVHKGKSPCDSDDFRGIVKNRYRMVMITAHASHAGAWELGR